MAETEPNIPEIYYESAPKHFDLAWPRWTKFLFVIILFLVALYYDLPIAKWLFKHPIQFKSDINLELIMLMQWGQWTCSVLTIIAVAMLDRNGRKKAISIAVGCICSVAACYLLKGLFGRARPWLLHQHIYGLYGPAMGFHSAAYQSFPSAHTSGAFALAAGLAWFYPNGRALFYFLAGDVAVQRVLRHAHYPSDVVAGAVLATVIVRTVLWTGLPGRIMAKFPREWQKWIFTPNAEPTRV